MSQSNACSDLHSPSLPLSTSIWSLDLWLQFLCAVTLTRFQEFMQMSHALGSLAFCKQPLPATFVSVSFLYASCELCSSIWYLCHMVIMYLLSTSLPCLFIAFVQGTVLGALAVICQILGFSCEQNE